VWRRLQRCGIDPAPRRASLTGQPFLATQAEGTLACDFFQVGTVLRKLLDVLVVLKAPHGRVHSLA
jgi:putative transposase